MTSLNGYKFGPPREGLQPITGYSPINRGLSDRVEDVKQKGLFRNIGSLASDSFDNTRASLALYGAARGLVDKGTAAEYAAHVSSNQSDKPQELTEFTDTLREQGREFGEAEGAGKVYEAIEGVGQGLVEAITNPKGAAYFLAEQSANLLATHLPGLGLGKVAGAAGGLGGPVGAAVGGAGGYIAGSALGSFAIESGAEIHEAINELGGDPSNKNDVLKVLNDPAIMESIRIRGEKKGLPIALVDAVVNATVGKYVGGASTVKQAVKRGAVGQTAQITGAGVGEAAGQQWARGTIDYEDLALEVGGESVTGVVDTAASAYAMNKANKNSEQSANEQLGQELGDIENRDISINNRALELPDPRTDEQKAEDNSRSQNDPNTIYAGQDFEEKVVQQLPQLEPEALIVSPDGAVGTAQDFIELQSQRDAMGLTEVQGANIKLQPLPEEKQLSIEQLPPDALYVMPDGSTGNRFDVETYRKEKASLGKQEGMEFAVKGQEQTFDPVPDTNFQEELVPEKQDTLDAQVDAMKDGRKPAILITEGEPFPQDIPEGARIAKIEGRGLLIYNDDETLALAKSGKMGEALGYGIDEKPQTDTVLTAKDEQGRIVADIATDGSQNVQQAAETLAGNSGTVESRPVDNAIADRLEKQTTGEESALDQGKEKQDYSSVQHPVSDSNQFKELSRDFIDEGGIDPSNGLEEREINLSSREVSNRGGNVRAAPAKEFDTQPESIASLDRSEEKQTEEREGSREIVEGIIKRRKAASEINKLDSYEKALDDAKSFMSGKDISPSKFTKAAKTFRNDAQLSSLYDGLAQQAKDAQKSNKAAEQASRESYLDRIQQANTEQELNKVSREIIDDQTLSDDVAIELDDAVMDAMDSAALLQTPDVAEAEAKIAAENKGKSQETGKVVTDNQTGERLREVNNRSGDTAVYKKSDGQLVSRADSEVTQSTDENKPDPFAELLVEDIEQHPNLKDASYVKQLEEVSEGAGWAERGGKMIRDISGDVIARTKWLPKEAWFADKPDGVTEKDYKEAVTRIKEGRKLTMSQRKALSHMIDNLSAFEQSYVDHYDLTGVEAFDSLDPIEKDIIALAEQLDGITQGQGEALLEQAALQGLSNEQARENIERAIQTAQSVSSNEKSREEGQRSKETKRAEAGPELNTQKSSSAPQDSAALEDFGEKMAGARKDQAQSYSGKLSGEFVSLAKSFPQPNYEKLSESGVNRQALALVAQMRSEIPSKPRYGAELWAKNASSLRETAKRAMDEEAFFDRFLNKISESSPGHLKHLPSILKIADDIPASKIPELGKYKIAEKFYSVYHGEENVTKFVVYESSKGKGKQLEGFDTLEQASDFIRSKVTEDKKKAQLKFEVRFDRSMKDSGKPYYLNKTGDPNYTPLKHFASTSEARAFIRENNNELAALWDEVKAVQNVSKRDTREKENRPRTGEDYRKGKDVTPEEFSKAFGFRGVEYGNWVSQGKGGKERQGMLNLAYDALMDLSRILNIPPEAISLNGELGLAFGSRGKGSASAHYEPSNVVINLTKTKGAGTLAHEWFHALDNYFQKKRGETESIQREDNYITYKPEPLMIHESGRSWMTKEKLAQRRARHPESGFFAADKWKLDPDHPGGVRPEVERGFAELVQAIDESPMSNRSAKMDKKADGYWSRIIEKAARSFENYVIASMEQGGYSNDYLANVKSFEGWGKLNPEKYPYLKKGELKPVKDAFDKLFSEIKTRKTNKGTELYSKGQSTGSTSEQISELARRRFKPLSKLIDSGEVKVVQSVKELPDSLRSISGDTAQGLFDGKTTYLVADSLDESSIDQVVMHEMTHRLFEMDPGVKEKLIGKQGELTAIFDDVKSGTYKGSYKSFYEKVLKRIPDDTPTQNIVEEFAAYTLTEYNEGRSLPTKLKQWAQSVMAMFRQALRKIGFNMNFQPSDLQLLVKQSMRRVNLESQPANALLSKAQAEGYEGEDAGEAQEWLRAKAKGLDMSKEARMQRARDMGFDTEQVYYHGTSKDFDEFNLDMGGASYGIDEDKGLAFFTSLPDEAEYSAREARYNLGGEENTIPVYLRIENPISETSKGKDSSPTSYLDGSKARLTDELEFSTDEYGASFDAIKIFDDNETVVAVNDASNVRSINAAFDPDYSDSSNLLASKVKFSRVSPIDGDAIRSSISDRLTGLKDNLDTFRYYAQDKNIDVKRVQEMLGDLPDAQNPYQKIEIWEGVAGEKLNDFDEDYVQPLKEAIAATQMSLDEVGKWLVARHAEEANAYLASINPDKPAGERDRLSGMSNQEAETVLASNRGNRELDYVGELVDLINREKLNLLTDEGLITKDEAEQWRSRYKKYVPLFRDDVDQMVGNGRGQGFNIKGKESKARTGSAYLEPTNIVAHILEQYERAVVRSEKNKVGKAVLDMAENNPDSNWWSIDKQKTVKSVRDGKVVENTDPREADNELNVKVNGETHTITFNQNNKRALRMARGLKNLDAPKLGGAMKYLQLYNRLLSSLNTSWSPEFLVTNFFRDVQTAGYNLSSTEIDSATKEVLKNIPKAIKGIHSQLRGDGSSEWAEIYEDFRKHGGKTGWIDTHKDILDRGRKLQKEIGRLMDGKPDKTTFTRVANLVDDYNTVIENGVRLSSYKSAIDRGLSKEKAAAIAKGLTVNFNKKGAAGPALNALYLFYNASMQGNVRLIQTLVKSKKARGYAAATVGLAVALDIMNQAVSGEDDDGENIYDNIDEYTKAHNLIIMGEKEPIIKLPLPWGFNVLHVIGQSASRMARDETYSSLDAMSDTFSATLDAFNPVASGSMMQTLSPTITDMAVQIAENKDYAGRPLKPEGYNRRSPEPEYQMHWKSATAFSQWATEELNKLSGGNSVRPGAVNWSPEWLDLFISNFTGAAGRFYWDTSSAAIKVSQGDELESKEIPFWRKVHGYNTQYGIKSRYYDWSTDIAYTKSELKKLRGEERREVAESDQARLVGIYSRTEKVLRKLRKLRKASEDQEQIEALDEKMRREMAKFNRSYARIVLRNSTNLQAGQ